MTDELDYDDIEETFAALRDHLRAADIVALANGDEEAARETIASLFAVIRHTAESMGVSALALRRVPATAEGIARGLDDLAAALRELVVELNGADA